MSIAVCALELGVGASAGRRRMCIPICALEPGCWCGCRLPLPDAYGSARLGVWVQLLWCPQIYFAIWGLCWHLADMMNHSVSRLGAHSHCTVTGVSSASMFGCSALLLGCLSDWVPLLGFRTLWIPWWVKRKLQHKGPEETVKDLETKGRCSFNSCDICGSRN